MSFNLMNIGTSALLANQAGLTTTGHNIANVNTAGYSRQSTVQGTRDGQFAGNGFVGRGVDVTTVMRNRNDFLNTNAILTQSISAADTARAGKLSQLEQLFPVGENGLGAAINNVFSAFTDLSSMPNDVTTRTALLARLNDMTARFNATSSQLDNLQTQINGQMDSDVVQINKLAGQLASINGQIQRVTGSGHDPNDLLDQRQQMISDLNKLVQTSTVDAGDGTLSVFVAGGLPLVTGVNAAQFKLVTDAADPKLKSVVLQQAGQQVTLDFQSLAGGDLAGLARFQSQDLNDARNTVGRMALALANTLNNQHQLGLDMNGSAGGPLFNIPSFKGSPNPSNTGTALVQADVSDPTGNALQPSDYEVSFTSGSTGTITRLSDGMVTAFGALPTPGSPLIVDGLSFTLGGSANAGDKFTIKPGASAAQLSVAVSAPQKLVATPVSYQFGTQNQGTLNVSTLNGPQQSSPTVRNQTNPYLTSPVTLTFHVIPGAPDTYTFDVSGDGTGNPSAVAYSEGPPSTTISYNGWSLKLNDGGIPVEGDVITIQSFQAAANTRTPLLSGVGLSDAYATALANIGTAVQSGQSAADLSTAIANDAKTAATSVSGVNLDEEASKLLQYQQAYQASAKILQVAQTVFDTLLQTTAR